MSVDSIDDLMKMPSRERFDFLVKKWSSSGQPAWLSPVAIQVLLMGILIESSQRLEGLTRWLVRLTWGLFFLAVVLAILTGGDLVWRFFGPYFGNSGAGPG